MISVSTEAKQQVLKDLDLTEWDLEHEIAVLKNSVIENDLPQIRIEHNETGKHRFYIDKGESYLANWKQFHFLKVMTLPALVVAEQQIRALWLEGEDQARCSAIDGQITSSNPISKACEQCPESIPGFGSCKPKVRLFVLPLLKRWHQPMIFSLSPTSIKLWREHQLKLYRSGLPAVAVITTFELEDVKTEEYRWARVKVGVRDIASKSKLMEAIQFQQTIRHLKKRIIDRDFNEKGDKA